MTKADLIRCLQHVDDNAEIVIIEEETDGELSLQDICPEDEFIIMFVNQIP